LKLFSSRENCYKNLFEQLFHQFIDNGMKEKF
jgi:hypothetical protein